MKRVLNLGSFSRIVEGDPNEITDYETQSGSDIISGDVSKDITLIAAT